MEFPASKGKLIIITAAIVVVVSVGFGSYFFYQFQKVKNSPTLQAQIEVTDIVAKVAKLYLIPTGEEPSLATVSDPQALKSQSFFEGAQRGDSILIFTKAKKIVLYRSSINKIIAIAPISESQNNETSAPEKTTETLNDKTF